MASYTYETLILLITVIAYTVGIVQGGFSWETGNIIITLRNQKDWSQGELTKESGVSCELIGKYECGEAASSIEAAKKIASALGVKLDHLIKGEEYEQIDNEMLKRLKEVQRLDDENKVYIFATIDAFIKATKLKSIAAL